jgi:hypothetical protein
MLPQRRPHHRGSPPRALCTGAIARHQVLFRAANLLQTARPWPALTKNTVRDQQLPAAPIVVRGRSRRFECEQPRNETTARHVRSQKSRHPVFGCARRRQSAAGRSSSPGVAAPPQRRANPKQYKPKELGTKARGTRCSHCAAFLYERVFNAAGPKRQHCTRGHIFG